MSARGPPPDWLSFLAALRPAHNDRADRPILRWQACRGQVNVKCSADILLAHRALPDAIHPLHRRRPVAPPATPELLCLSVAVADEIRFACLCATLVVLRQSLTVAPRNLNAYFIVAPDRYRSSKSKTDLSRVPDLSTVCRFSRICARASRSKMFFNCGTLRVLVTQLANGISSRWLIALASTRTGWTARGFEGGTGTIMSTAGSHSSISLATASTISGTEH